MELSGEPRIRKAQTLLRGAGGDYVHGEVNAVADDGVVDVGGGGDFERGYAEGGACAVDAAGDAGAADASATEAGEEQEKNEHAARGAPGEDAARRPMGRRKKPRRARAAPPAARGQTGGVR